MRGYAKPDLRIYQLCLDSIGVDAADAVFIGDGGSNELHGAQQVGLTTIMITGIISELWPEKIAERRPHADYEIEWLGELISQTGVNMTKSYSYAEAGVDIDVADATKLALAQSVNSGDPRVLNRLGAFASLVDGDFPQLAHPVLVLKTEEPGSKQKLAFQYGRIASIAQDLVNHLVNDIIVMGAEPLYVQDCIICGGIEPDVIKTLVSAIASACKEIGCTLVGGETSEQPGVLDRGTYLLSAFIVGAVEREHILDGSRITENDVVLAVASNGLHTNGYSLVRALIDNQPDILDLQIEGESFLDAILRPHKCYYHELKGLFRLPGLKGLAHITGGGIEGNLNRILPASLDARIDRERIKVLPVFKTIRERGRVTDADMLRTFNLGVGVTLVCSRSSAAEITRHLEGQNCTCYPIGEIVRGTGKVDYYGSLVW